MSIQQADKSASRNELLVPPKQQMVLIHGGSFLMGSNRHYPEEAPVHRATVGAFWMDNTPVTNAQFRKFVESTGYVTVAEIPPDPRDHPGALPKMPKPGSLVFGPIERRPRRTRGPWWTFQLGANWRCPYGEGSSIKGLDDHPVVHIAYKDAETYAAWTHKELPTEAEWEFAARGGLESAEYGWGNDLLPGGRHMANTWQGKFPNHNIGLDGYLHTSPVMAFPANGYGLYDTIGNVWEWTVDWYTSSHDAVQSCRTPRNAPAGRADASFDPRQPHNKIPRKVLKGGSHLCAPNYCRRYRPAARLPQPIDSSASHIGFRCIIRQPR